jgi:hypothetical protein
MAGHFEQSAHEAFVPLLVHIRTIARAFLICLLWLCTDGHGHGGYFFADSGQAAFLDLSDSLNRTLQLIHGVMTGEDGGPALTDAVSTMLSHAHRVKKAELSGILRVITSVRAGDGAMLKNHQVVNASTLSFCITRLVDAVVELAVLAQRLAGEHLHHYHHADYHSKAEAHRLAAGGTPAAGGTSQQLKRRPLHVAVSLDPLAPEWHRTIADV